MPERVAMPLWGWGDPAHAREIPVVVERDLAERIGAPRDAASRRQQPDEFELPTAKLDGAALASLTDAVGSDAVDASPAARLFCALGKSYPDTLRMRAGRPGCVPDAVVRPRSREQLETSLRELADLDIAIVPFGGGTSVVGGLEAVSEGFAGAVTIDLSRLSGLESLDRVSMLGTFLPGTRGPEAEAALAPHGLTIGHFPQSWEFATLGGFAATRSAGQASTGYGRFDELVLGLAATTPIGRLDLRAVPASAAGPDLRELMIGSEGTLGVIDRLDVQLSELPAAKRDLAWSAPDFEAGRAAFRELVQSGLAPDVARLSDELETEINLMLAGEGLATSVLKHFLRLRGRSEGCMAITCFEGSPEEVSYRSHEAAAVLRRHGFKALGSLPAQAWRRHRFAGPYTRDRLMDSGYFVETLETAASWSKLEGLYRSVRSALREALGEAGGEPIVMCHVSHLYESGASLYFTFAGNTLGLDLEGNIEQWRTVKARACDAILAAGGTITHHHAVGMDHAPWLAEEIGDVGTAALRAVKAELDPRGVMNPGRLLLSAG